MVFVYHQVNVPYRLSFPDVLGNFHNSTTSPSGKSKSPIFSMKPKQKNQSDSPNLVQNSWYWPSIV